MESYYDIESLGDCIIKTKTGDVPCSRWRTFNRCSVLKEVHEAFGKDLRCDESGRVVIPMEGICKDEDGIQLAIDIIHTEKPFWKATEGLTCEQLLVLERGLSLLGCDAYFHVISWQLYTLVSEEAKANPEFIIPYLKRLCEVPGYVEPLVEVAARARSSWMLFERDVMPQLTPVTPNLAKLCAKPLCRFFPAVVVLDTLVKRTPAMSQECLLDILETLSDYAHEGDGAIMSGIACSRGIIDKSVARLIMWGSGSGSKNAKRPLPYKHSKLKGSCFHDPGDGKWSLCVDINMGEWMERIRYPGTPKSVALTPWLDLTYNMASSEISLRLDTPKMCKKTRVKGLFVRVAGYVCGFMGEGCWCIGGGDREIPEVSLKMGDDNYCVPVPNEPHNSLKTILMHHAFAFGGKLYIDIFYGEDMVQRLHLTT